MRCEGERVAGARSTCQWGFPLHCLIIGIGVGVVIGRALPLHSYMRCEGERVVSVRLTCQWGFLLHALLNHRCRCNHRQRTTFT